MSTRNRSYLAVAEGALMRPSEITAFGLILHIAPVDGYPVEWKVRHDIRQALQSKAPYRCRDLYCLADL